MKISVATLRGASRRPSVQDAGLAALLLVVTWAGYTGPSGPGWWWEPAARWALIGVCVAAVAARRRWPVAALAAASLAAVAEMALAAGPVPADLAAPVALYTVAVRRRRTVSLALLGAVLAVATAWSVHVGRRGRADDLTAGWSYTGPFGSGGSVLTPEGAGDPGPTDWGGLPVLGSLLLVAWAIGWGVQSRRAYVAELRRERDQQAALAVAAERARITRELHDVVAHGLAVIVMQAQGGAAAFARRPADTLAALDTIVATGRASLADMRHVLSASEQVDDPARPVPGVAHLPRLAEHVRQAGTPVQLRVDGTPRSLPSSVDVSAYRIVQEALTNTMKHAGPGASARVLVSYGSDELTLEAADDGTGAGSRAGSRAGSDGGSGLRGMRERAALLGGEVTAGPGPDGGYLVRARLPVDPAAPA